MLISRAVSGPEVQCSDDVGSEVFEDLSFVHFRGRHLWELGRMGVSETCLTAWRQIPTSKEVLDELGDDGEWWRAQWEDATDLMLEAFTRRAVSVYLIVKQLHHVHSDCGEVSMGHFSYACDCAEWLRQSVEKDNGSFPQLFVSREARDALNRKWFSKSN
jgi:hypothetical protein